MRYYHYTLLRPFDNAAHLFNFGLVFDNSTTRLVGIQDVGFRMV